MADKLRNDRWACSWRNAVTGVMLNLGLFFGQTVILLNNLQIEWLSLAWMIDSFISLQFFKVNMIVWIGISLGIGIITFILQTL